MKTLLSYLVVTALILTSSFTVNQQQQLNDQQSTNSCFNNFRVHRQGKAGVSVNWSVTIPDIAGFEVERSYDGEFFEPINTVNFNGSSTYKYHDNGVYPGIIYYRITAVKSDGSKECSPVESARIVQRG